MNNTPNICDNSLNIGGFSNFDYHFFSVLEVLRGQSTAYYESRPLLQPTINTVIPDSITSTSIEDLLLRPPQALDELFSQLFETDLSEDDYTEQYDSIYDESPYKKVLSAEGKKQLTYDTYSTHHMLSACPIQQTAFKEHDEIIVLPCQHNFHPESILQWLENEKAMCPVCRFELKSIEKKT